MGVSSVIERVESERKRERERERGEGARYTATINYTVTLDVGLFRGYRWRGLILGRMCSFGKN